METNKDIQPKKLSDFKSDTNLNDNQSENDTEEYENESDAESIDDYRPGGYHPVVLGETFNNGKYQVKQKLGFGFFSTVWLVQHTKTQNYYALKIQKSKGSYSESVLDEIEILEDLKKHQNDNEWANTRLVIQNLTGLNLQKEDTFTVEYLEQFKHQGINGKHYCTVFEIMGPSLYDLIIHYDNFDRGIPINEVKVITKQLLIGIDYMNRICNIIHTDLKPENVMIHLEDDELQLFVENLKKVKKKPMSMKYLEDRNQKDEQKQYDQQEQLEEEEEEEEEDDDDDEEEEEEEEEEEVAEDQETKESEAKSINSETLNTFIWKKKIKIPIDDKIKIKIVDFGNACWTHKHFSDSIQSRPYRAPEVLLGIDYLANTDIWSLGCMIFEMLTGRDLFKPKKGETYTKDEDHLALMIETVGPLPTEWALKGQFSRQILDRYGKLLNIKQFKDTPIKHILEEQFDFKSQDAQEIQDFLLPMFEYEPEKRISAIDALKSPWLYKQ